MSLTMSTAAIYTKTCSGNRPVHLSQNRIGGFIEALSQKYLDTNSKEKGTVTIRP